MDFGFAAVAHLLIAGLGLVIFLIYKAYNNEKFKLPVIGKFAEQQASK